MNFDNLELGFDNLNLLSFLVKTQADFDQFLLEFWRGEGEQFISVFNYRLYKIKELNMSFEVFNSLFVVYPKVELLQTRKINGLEQLFMQPISSDVTNAILNKINNRELTLVGIYSTFKNNVGMNATRFSQKQNDRPRRFV